MKKITLFLAMSMLVVFGYSQVSKNLNQLSNFTYSSTGVNDVWGFASANNEYALVGTYDGVSIVNVTTPASPVQVQWLPGVNTTWRDIKTHLNYAYVSNEAADGIRIIDLSGLPSAAPYKDTLLVAGGTDTIHTAHNLWIADGILYIVGTNVNPGGMEMFQLTTNPWNPIYVGSYRESYVHDVYVRNDTAYTGEIYDGELTIVNVTNKASPVVLGAALTHDQFTHNTWLNDDGTACFTTDEVAAAYVMSFDVTDPNNIVELDRVRSSQSNGAAIPHNVHVQDNFIVTSYYTDGVVVFDGDRAHNLIEVGYYDTSTNPPGSFNGCWGAYPFLPSGIILGSDASTGLHVLGAEFTRACYLEGMVTDSVTTNPISGAQIVINGPTVTDFSNGLGNYATGLADSGMYTATYSKFGYVSKTISVHLLNGILLIEDVELVPAASISYQMNIIEEGTGNAIPFAIVQADAGSTILNYTADASGVVTDGSFIEGSYTIIAGKWGWVTKEVSVVANGSNPTVTIELPAGYYDDYIFDFGWTVSGAATGGIWERGEPVGTTAFGSQMNPEDDLNSDLGDQCYVTGNGGGSAGQDDVDDDITILTSPNMDLSNYQDPVLRFYRWFANDGVGAWGPLNDTFMVWIDNGLTSVKLVELVAGGFNNWVQDTFIVSNFITPTANMTVRFSASDYSAVGGHWVEGAVDKFEVYDANVTGISAVKNEREISLDISPNPVVKGSFVNYDFGNEKISDANFKLTDLAGKVVYSRKLTAVKGNFILNVGLSNGIYIGTLELDGETVKQFKIVK